MRRSEVGIAVVDVGMVEIEMGRVGILGCWEVWCMRALGGRQGSSWVGSLPLRPAQVCGVKSEGALKSTGSDKVVCRYSEDRRL